MVKAVQELESGINAETVARNHCISKVTKNILLWWKSLTYRRKPIPDAQYPATQKNP